MNETQKAALIQYGMDYAKALERSMESEEFLYALLQHFANDTMPALLQAAIKDKDAKQAFHYAHTLKGAAANLGLLPIYDALVVLVDYLRTGEIANSETLFTVFWQQFQTFQIILGKTEVTT